MRPQKIGRALGIGLRVAGRVAGERLAAHQQTAGQPAQNQQVAAAAAERGAAGQAAGQAAGRASRNMARGIGGFLRPFGRVGRVVGLEVAGVFFLLPVVVFGGWMWRERASWEQGPEHRAFVASAVIVAVFLYLAVTSFWRAWRK